MTDLQTLLRELRKRHTAAENDLREMMDDLVFLERIIEIQTENKQLKREKQDLIEYIRCAIGGIDGLLQDNEDAEAVRETLENAILEKE